MPDNGVRRMLSVLGNNEVKWCTEAIADTLATLLSECRLVPGPCSARVHKTGRTFSRGWLVAQPGW